MKISVIIAAYNAEKYLAETLESVLNQTITDYEVIVINDGSVDSTLNILEEYAQMYSVLKIVNKENEGPSAARNIGLTFAKGEYIYFLDADDVIEPDALEMLYETAKDKDADVVIAKYDIFNRYKTFPVNNINKLVEQEEIDKYDTQILWTFALWNKLFRKSLIDKYHMIFPKDISYSEDGVFVMNYIYHSTRITGLDKVILHYRRMYDGETESITSFVTPSKVKDYIEAHHMILETAENSFLGEYPQYESIGGMVENEQTVYSYLNEIVRKELHVLINQFYCKYWQLDEDSLFRIINEIEDKMKRLDMRSIALLVNEYPDISLFDLSPKADMILENADFTAVLYGDLDTCSDFFKCLKSLTAQNLISTKIVVPEHMKKAIYEEGLMQNNIFFVESKSEKELFYQALETAQTPYITFCDPKFIYTNNAFRWIYKCFLKNSYDYITQLIYHQDYDESYPVLLNRISYELSKEGKENEELQAFDNTLANKFFKVEFLKKICFDKNHSIREYLEDFNKFGYSVFLNNGIVIYNDSEDSFASYIETEETKTIIDDYIKDSAVSLMSPELMLNPGDVYQKLQLFPEVTKIDKFIHKVINYAKRQPLKDQVLFFSIRKDGELEGNAKALYPFIKGKKVIRAKRLPHSNIETAKFFYDVITSKVIITDDYLRYLRYFAVRPEQRVIQLWHGCGAFKKFGQRGTNIPVKIDLATHAQYNLVCVSGEYVRKIYADAFGIDLKKVKALGCPRTDDFFNKQLMEKKKACIYSKFPTLKGKEIILYAPTFRDIANDRTIFEPELDFDRLSKDLNENQMFIICPHPLMQNEIVNKHYDNIKVIREFSTNEMMYISDMLITDYSSVIFEYALLRKPIAFYCYDLSTYNRGFYLKYPEDLPGDVFVNQKELTNYIKDVSKHTLTEKHNSFLGKYMSGCDGHSCERIASLINQYMEEK